MSDRLTLHEKLIEVLGSRYVYFQPPSNVRMKYPCIRYELSKKRKEYANNKTYIKRNIYTITIIDTDPESSIPDRLEELDHISNDRNYCTEGLYHFVYTITI